MPRSATKPGPFVTLDDLREAHLAELTSRLRGASAMARTGLSFIIAPMNPSSFRLRTEAVRVTPSSSVQF